MEYYSKFIENIEHCKKMLFFWKAVSFFQIIFLARKYNIHYGMLFPFKQFSFSISDFYFELND